MFKTATQTQAPKLNSWQWDALYRWSSRSWVMNAFSWFGGRLGRDQQLPAYKTSQQRHGWHGTSWNVQKCWYLQPPTMISQETTAFWSPIYRFLIHVGQWSPMKPMKPCGLPLSVFHSNRNNHCGAHHTLLSNHGRHRPRGVVGEDLGGRHDDAALLCPVQDHSLAVVNLLLRISCDLFSNYILIMLYNRYLVYNQLYVIK